MKENGMGMACSKNEKEEVAEPEGKRPLGPLDVGWWVITILILER
jgi:hypothetical protein